MTDYIGTMKLSGSVIFRTGVCLCTGLLLGLCSASAAPPHNDRENQSVEQVLSYHYTREDNPETLEYVSWSPVSLLENGHYKVTVIYRVRNRFGRSVKKKQIVIMDASGDILKVLDCR